MSGVIIKKFLLGGWIGVRVLRLRKCLHSLADTNFFWGLPCFSKLLSSCAFILFQFNTFHESCIFKHHFKKKTVHVNFLSSFFFSSLRGLVLFWNFLRFQVHGFSGNSQRTIQQKFLSLSKLFRNLKPLTIQRTRTEVTKFRMKFLKIP